MTVQLGPILIVGQEVEQIEVGELGQGLRGPGQIAVEHACAQLDSGPSFL
jgi:hypothetical protein